jgi:hypothetical protein
MLVTIPLHGSNADRSIRYVASGSSYRMPVTAERDFCAERGFCAEFGFDRNVFRMLPIQVG